VNSISVNRLSVGEVGDYVKPSTYAAIAVKAPRYCTASVKRYLRDVYYAYKDTQYDRRLASAKRHHVGCWTCECW